MRNCAQPVHTVGVQGAFGVSLYAVGWNPKNRPVHFSPTYTGFKPTFVLGLVHYFFNQLVSVRERVVHIIHSTNKDDSKFKMINNS